MTKYALNHTGYCLEFLNRWPLSEAKEVRYQNNVEMDITDKDQRLGAFYYYKRRKWEQEEELRIVGRRSADRGHVAFDPAILTRIIFGKHMLPEHQALIRDWAARRNPPLVVISASELTLS